MAGLFSGYGAARPARPAPPRRNPYGGSVATGARTRAYRQGYRGAGEPIVPAPAGAPGAAPATPAAAGGAPTWTPPPLGSYDPTRDVEIEQGEAGLGQLEGDLRTGVARDTSDYFNRLGAIQRAQAQEGQDYGRQKEALQRAYSALAGQQGERA